MPLAIASYQQLTALTDGRDVLSLAWTVDEQACLSVDLHALLAAVLRDEAVDAALAGVEAAGVDPYGEIALRFRLEAGLWPDLGDCGITCGAGVNSLLHNLASLARHGSAYVIGDAYPDYPHWFACNGGACHGAAVVGDVSAHIDRIRHLGVAVVLIDRPNLAGTDLGLDALRGLALALASQGTLVVVDESYANYLPPQDSAANIVGTTPNLCVLRGLSKAYQLGSLRLGYALAGRAAHAQVRRAVVPHQVSALSLRLGAAVLALGDIAAPLRARVAQNKPQMLELLGAVGIPAFSTSPWLPYVFLPGVGDGVDAPPGIDARHWLEARELVGKRQPFWSASSGEIAYRYRLSVPLEASRWERFERKFISP